jgi:hypothetical protein
MKKYKIKVDKKLLKRLKIFWKFFKIIENKYWNDINKLEEDFKKEFGINIEFFHCDGGCVGIGNYDRTMKLIHKDELENE